MRFVVQKHAASRLHYDFRLEVEGALKSWAVPKGPSLNPRDRRLAVPVEDHSLRYIDFEGRIAEGSYGAGEVIVWDIGGYENLTENGGAPVPMGRALVQGHARFWLHGQKLKGGWSLRRFQTGREENWLLVKLADEFAEPETDITADRPESVLTGRTVEMLAAGKRR